MHVTRGTMESLWVQRNIEPIVEQEHLFLGGSRRFGYDTEYSDTDVFVYIPESDPRDAMTYLTFIGFKYHSDYSIKDSNPRYSWSHLRKITSANPRGIYWQVDLLVTHNLTEFDRLRLQHDLLAVALDVEDIRFILELKKQIASNVTQGERLNFGKYIYRALLKAKNIS